MKMNEKSLNMYLHRISNILQINGGLLNNLVLYTGEMSFISGRKWVYFKIYTGTKTTETILKNELFTLFFSHYTCHERLGRQRHVFNIIFYNYG